MDKNKLIEIKKRLLALGLAGVMLGTAGCTSNKDENGVPKHVSISSEYSNVDDYYKYVMQNGEAVSEYIFYKKNILCGLGCHVELYDLPNENMIVYSDGISTTYNEEYYKYIIENNYQVCLTEVSDYVEGHTGKDYYSLDEIKELEPQIGESLKIINSAKVKTK